MKEHPIIFSTDSVRAILEGRKTQTRRVIKPQPQLIDYIPKGCRLARKIYEAKYDSRIYHFHNSFGAWVIKDYCPYGQVGDRLWVKENHTYGGGDYDTQTCYICYSDGIEIKHKIPMYYSWDKTCKWCYTKLDGTYPIRPSIFMPRWASRINLGITGLRVERLQEITEEDMAREGIEVTFHSPGDFGLPNPCATGVVDLPNGQRRYSTALCCWQSLWDSLNVKRGYGWNKNPWVWVIEFKILQ